MTTRGFSPRSHYSYLKDNGLVILFEVESEDISVHECGTTLAEDIDCFLQELHLDPGHVVLLHLLHLLLHLSVQLMLKAQTLHVVHVAITVEQVPLQGCPRSLSQEEKLKSHNYNECIIYTQKLIPYLLIKQYRNLAKIRKRQTFSASFVI